MRILGIDYGRKKVGVAFSEGFLAEPLRVIKYSSLKSLVEKIKWIVESEGVERVVVGISEGEMGKESEEFSRSLGKVLNMPVETFDETLTSKDAQRFSLESGISRKKRREMEDAYAASLMLQNYLDSQG